MAAVRAPSPRTRHARSLFAGLPGTYDRMAALLSLGQDGRWRRFMVSTVPAGAELVLDVAAGTGAVALELAARPGVRVVAVDQSEPMARAGARRVGELGTRVRFVVGQAEWLPFPDRAFDALTFTYLLRYVDDPPATLAELARVVRPGGVVANLEFHLPRTPLWHLAWWVYTRGVLPAAGRAVSRAWGEVGRFLGPSISRFYRAHPLEEQLGWWRRAGIEDVRARVMSLGGGVVIWGTRGGAG